MPKVNITQPSLIEETDELINAPQDVYDLAYALIKKHPELDFLFSYQIKYVFRKKAKNKGGRRVLGTAKVFQKNDKLLHSWDGQVTLDREFWLNNPQSREALLVHELCHYERDDVSGALSLAGHDIEEFFYVFKHYGDWKGELQKANQGQLELQLNTMDMGQHDAGF